MVQEQVNIRLPLKPKAAGRLAYLTGQADAASKAATLAREAAIDAERIVRDMLGMLADQAGESLPATYTMQIDHEHHICTIIAQTETQLMPTLPESNGVAQEGLT